jgi:hypothetical protein
MQIVAMLPVVFVLLSSESQDISWSLQLELEIVFCVAYVYITAMPSMIVLGLSAILSAKSPVVAAVSKSETTDAIVVKLRVIKIPSLNMIS